MKALYIIKREYLENVRKKSFIISTLVAPIILLAFYAIPILAIFFVPSEQYSVAVLDHTGRIGDRYVASLTDTLKDGRPKYLAQNVQAAGQAYEEKKATLVAALDNDGLDIIIQIPTEALETGRVNYVSKDVFNENVTDYLRDQLNPILVASRLEGVGLDYEQVTRLTQRTRFNEQKITKGGMIEEGELIGEYVLVIIFVMILYTSLLTWGMAVQRGIIEEKSSRVIEVMLSSVEPRDLFIGKIIGIGSLGLTQVLVWAVMMFALNLSSGLATVQFMEYVNISGIEIFYFVLFFLLGFLFYASIFTIIGAVCSEERDAQNLQSIVILPLVLPIMTLFFIIQNPNTTFSVVLSLIPPFTPMLMLARVVLGEPSFWQVALGIVLLLVSTWLVILFSARVFRVGILMYGKPPSPREIIRWFRMA